jgi:hypothetical protein
METTKTRAQLVVMASEELMIVGEGQSLEDGDRIKIDAKVDGLLGELADRGVCYVPNEGYIPSEFANPLATLLAVECSPIFGKQKDYNAREDAENRLRIIVRRQAAPNNLLETDSMMRRGGGYSYTQWRSGT